MASPIARRKKALETVLIRIRIILREEALRHRVFIADLNRKQLRAGEKADGSDMPDYVADSKQPSAPGAITLFDEGDFHDAIDVMFSDEGFDIVNDDEKAEFLLAKFGEVLGLNQENRLLLRARMLPGLRQRVNALI
jgi:hypothetical protein